MADSVLSKTAQGATFLILLQITSRALTFIVNQVLLRFLTPQILGVATQLELFAISILYFARESIRVAIQRQTGVQHDTGKIESANQGSKRDQVGTRRRVQEVVNLSWAAVGLGLLITFVFAWLYVRKADAAVLETPYLQASLRIYCLATFVELLNEPSFAIAQQQMLYRTRASAEMQATLTRCVVTCAVAISTSRMATQTGVLPFALGQLAYAVVLNLSYFSQVASVCKGLIVSRTPKSSDEGTGYVSDELISTVWNLYGQSLFKQLLTSGDQYLVAALTSLSSQGSYALASNYGGLLARILFQPIEESSRSFFARLLPSKPDHLTATEKKSAQTGTQQVVVYLTRLLHAYLLLSLLATTLGPPLSRPILHLVAGPSWSTTEAPLVLSSYCYYIPVLALNGILEAFVAAVATSAELQLQSLWMIAFSALFAMTGFVVLGLLELGARGLVLANVVTMSGRVLWSWRFVTTVLKKRGGHLKVSQILPSSGAIASSVVSRAILQSLKIEGGNFVDLVKAGGVAGVCGILL